jgi:hypothetical protein
MNMTRHANTRSQQRAIPPMMVDLLLQFGKSEAAGTGFAKMFFDRQARKRIAAYAGPLASLLGEHLDLYAVVDQDMQIITVGHRLERIRRH